MDYHQRNDDDNYSTLMFSQPRSSLSLTSSTTSRLDSVSKTNSLMMPKQSNIDIDRSVTQHRSFPKRQKHRISSHSAATSTIISHPITGITEKQEARPLGTCVRKCVQCRQLKHILLAECTACFRMMDVDLKDCKCQMFTNRNMIDHFICNLCNCELTLDGYIICANRTCQTILSALINKESTIEVQEKSVILTNICYSKSTHRTVAVQVNTLDSLPPLQRSLPTIIDNKNEESSSSLSWSKCDLDGTRFISSGSSDTSHMSIDSGVDASLNHIARHITAAFNSNQPTKLALQSEDQLLQQQSEPRNLTTTNDIIVKNSLEFTKMPKSPRCLAIMNVRKRHDRLSTLLKLQTNQTCQTQLSCLTDIDEMVQSEELSNSTIIRTTNPTKIDRQIQVDTIKGRFDDLCQVRIEIADRTEKDSTIDERILQALIDRDGQRWSEFVDQLLREQSHFSPSEIAKQLLDTIERLHTAEKLNSLTTGQLQRKIRYAMSQFKHIDERVHLQNNLKTTTKNRSEINSRRNTECNGRVDMAVTVRQIDKRHNRQSIISSDQNWKPYVDRLFDQGHSADEIQRLLHEAAEATMRSDDQRLQDVFSYIHTQAKQQRAKTAPAGIEFISTPTKTKLVNRQQFQSSKSYETTHGSKTISNESSPMLNNNDQGPIIQAIKHKSSSPRMTIQGEKGNEKKSGAGIFEQKTSQNQEVDEPKTSPISRTTSFDNLKSSSTVVLTPSEDTSSISPKEKCIQALHRVQNSLDVIDNTDDRSHLHPSNIQSEINNLIHAFKSNLHKPDNIEFLMTQCIELLNNEKKAILPQLEQIQYRNLNKEISKTLNLLQEYKKILIPSIANNEDSSFNRNISNQITVLPDALASLQHIEVQSQRIQLPSNTTLNLKQRAITSEYQETGSLIRCRPIPYTSSHEKRSTETLKQVPIDSTEHIALENKNLDEELIENNNDHNYVLDISSKTENNLHDDQSQIKWLDSLLSKISDNVSTKTINLTDIVSTSPSLSLIDHNSKQEPIIIEIADKQVPLLSNRVKSIDHHTTNLLEVISDKQNALYRTDRIIFGEEHALLTIIPEQDFSILDEPFQVVQTKISQTKAAMSSKQSMNSEDQSTPFYDEIQKESLDFDHDFNISKRSASITTLHANNLDEETQSTSSVANDQPQFVVTQSTSSSDVELSDQLDPLQLYEDAASSEQFIADNTPQKLWDHRTDKNIPSILTLEDMDLYQTDNNTDPQTSTQSSLVKDQENEQRKTSVSSFLPVQNEDQNLININEDNTGILKTANASHSDIQVLNEHASIATSKIVNHQNQINKLQLPVSAQYFSMSNIIQSTSLLTHLNDQDDTVLFKESVFIDNPTSDIQKQSSINSDNENIVATSIQNNENEKLNNQVTGEFHLPTILLLNHHIAQQSTNTVLSPSQSIKIENIKYKKLTIPSPSPLELPSSPEDQIHQEDELMVKHGSAPHPLIEESSGSATSLTRAATTKDDEGSHRSKSITYDLPIDDLSKKLNPSNDQLQNEHHSPVLSNTTSQESSSFDDTNRTSPSPLKSKENLIDAKTDGRQTETQSTITRTFSRSKSFTEDLQTPLISTPHSSLLSTISANDTHMKLKQQLEREAQLILEDEESPNASSSTTLNQENRSNKMPSQSDIKEKSPSNESTPLENNVAREQSDAKYDTSEENPSVHSSSSQLEQSRRHENPQPKKINSSKSKSLTNQLISLSDKQSMVDNHNETKAILDQVPPKSPAEHEDRNQDQLDNQKFKRINSSSSIKRRTTTSTTTAVSSSSIINVNTQEQNSKLQISLPDSKNDQSTPEETQEQISVSSFNLAHLNNLTPDNRYATEGEQLTSQMGKSSTGDSLHRVNSKRQPSLTNSLIRNGLSSSPIPRLLLKRPSIKQSSITVQSIKPNVILSETNVSTSSSNTVTTDQLLTTHSIISDQEEIISLKKVNKGNNSKDGLMITPASVPKRKVLRKTLQPSQNQSFIIPNSKEQHIKTSKKEFRNNSLFTISDLAYDTEPGSDAWMQIHEDISQILIIDEQDERKPQIHERHQKKQTKNRMIDGSRLLPFNLKARGDHQAYTVDSSKLPSIDQSCGQHHMKKFSNDPSRRHIIRLPVTQIEKFECGTIGPRLHPSSMARQLFYLPSIHPRHQFYQTTESLTDRFYRLMSAEKNDDKQAFESIVNWQQHHIPKIEQNKFQYMYLLDPSTGDTVRGRQYPILTDEIDLIDDPNTCTIVNKWAFADLVNAEREKFIQESTDDIKNSTKRSNLNKNIQICLRKRPLTQFEQNVFKEVDIISIVDSETLLLHIPSITVDNQVFIKNRKFKCDQTFNEHCQINTIYHSTLAPLLDKALDDSKCLCLIGGGKYSGKTYLLRSLIDLLAFDLLHLLSTYDIYIKLLGICHNRIVDLLQNYSPIRLMKSMNWTLIPNDEFHIKTDQDIDYIVCQIKKRRRFIHQIIQINFHQKDQSTIIGSLMIVVLASSQYVYTRNLCSHRRKFLINSLNKTMLAFKRALLGIRQNPDRVRAAFNNDILTRLIQPYVFHDRSNVCYIGTLNPGHRHRIATKSTLEFARNLRFCLKRINKQRRKREKLSQINSNNDDTF